MNKQLIVKKVIDHLSNELELFHRAAKAAFDEATDEQNKSESKYDTRGLEASYLARGQARQVAETEQAIAQFKSMTLPEFSAGDPIALGALVELDRGRDRAFYLIGPCAGGTEIQHGGKTLLVITTQSPLGRQLVGRKQGDRVSIDLGGSRQEHRIVSVT